MSGCQGLRVEGNGEWLLIGMRFLFGVIKNVLELVVMAVQPC